MCTSTRAIPICIPPAASSVAPSPPSSVACREKDRERRIRTRGERVSGNRRRKKKKTEERGRVRQYSRRGSAL